MNQNYLALSDILEKSSPLLRKLHNEHSHVIHFLYVFVPKYNYFFQSEIKPGFIVEKVYMNFRIKFQTYIANISGLKHNYFLMLEI